MVKNKAKEVSVVEAALFIKVVDIISKKNYNAHDVVLNLATKYPEIFLEVVDAHEPEWFVAVKKIHTGRNLMECIKMCRGTGGFGLREAKDLVQERFTFQRHEPTTF